MEYASNAKGNLGVTLGAIGTGLGALGGNGGGILGGLFGNNNCACSENMLVNRYEAGQQAEIERLRTEVSLRDANIYSDQKLNSAVRYLEEQIGGLKDSICQQAVINQHTADAIARERDERCCGDNAIVSYANATFYPKMVADITTGTTTTAQMVYNPLPNCGCGCRK